MCEENGRSSNSRLRHMSIRYFFVKDYVTDEVIVINYVPTDEMISDILTKPLQGSKFRYLRDKLLGTSS